jgi:GntR family transcriptional regulator
LLKIRFIDIGGEMGEVMLKICIDTQSAVPYYQQIVEQVKKLVNDQQLRAGEQIPAVREMAKWLQVNPSTVARAYYDLKMDGIVATSRRRGTIILGSENTLIKSLIPRNNFFDKASGQTRESISQGTQDEGMAAIFSLHLAHWQVQRSAQ